MTIIRVGNGWHEEEHDDAIATGAAAGVYTLAVNLDKPGRIKAASATITGVGVAWNNCVCRFAVSLPVPGAFVYGAYATQILLGVYQFGAGAQNIQVTWWVLVED